MAIYPCDAGPHRYPQPQQSAYRTIVTANRPLTLAARLCPKHFRELQTVCIDDLVFVDEDSTWSTKCDCCGEPPTTLANIRLFPNKLPEMQYAGQFCDGCANLLLTHLSITAWRPLPDR